MGTGKAACFAADEFFRARLSNPHTRTAYAHQVGLFLAWCEEEGLELHQVTPGLADQFLDELPCKAPTKNQAPAALRHFFNVLVARHAVLLNPFYSVRGVLHLFGEGRTPEASVKQDRRLPASIKTEDVYGLRDRAVLGRDRAVLGTLIYTGARVGAISRLRMEDLRDQGNPNPDTAGLGGCNDVTPLHIAKNIFEIQPLLDAGADPNVQDVQGRTPLHLAMILDKGEEVMMALLNAGADPDILDNKGRDAAMALMQRLDPHQGSHVQDLMWAEVEADAKGMSIDEFYKAHPHRKARIDSYKPRDERLENRMLVELKKAGSFGRALRRSFEMDPNERHEYLKRVLDDRRDRILMRMSSP